MCGVSITCAPASCSGCDPSSDPAIWPGLQTHKWDHCRGLARCSSHRVCSVDTQWRTYTHRAVHRVWFPFSTCLIMNRLHMSCSATHATIMFSSRTVRYLMALRTSSIARWVRVTPALWVKSLRNCSLQHSRSWMTLFSPVTFSGGFNLVMQSMWKTYPPPPQLLTCLSWRYRRALNFIDLGWGSVSSACCMRIK